jgi:hypothetical protein
LIGMAFPRRHAACPPAMGFGRPSVRNQVGCLGNNAWAKLDARLLCGGAPAEHTQLLVMPAGLCEAP